MAVARPLVGGGFFATYSRPVVEQFAPRPLPRAVHSIWFGVLGEQGFPTFFVWVGITIAGASYARRVIRRATGVPGLEWCVNLAKMAQVLDDRVSRWRQLSSLSYWDYYFTILVAVSAIYQHVTATLGSVTEKPRKVTALPQHLVLSR
jgi:hypothetical protein